MTRSHQVSIALVRNWTRLYTRGLPPEARQDRLDEIDSDLWEQAQLSSSHVKDTTGSALQVLLRLMLGLWSDVAWRIETGAGGNLRKEQEMNAAFLGMRTTSGGRAEKVFLACVALLALYQAIVVIASIGFGIGLWGGSGADDAGQGWYLSLPTSAASLVLIWAGLQSRAKAPLKGGILIALGVLPSILMFWMMLPPVIAIGVAVYAIVHGRSEQKRIDAGV